MLCFVNKARCCARCANNERCTKTVKVTQISKNGMLSGRLKLVVSKTIGFQIIHFCLCTSATTSSRAPPARRANTRCLCEKHNKRLTTGWPLLTDTPSWSIMLREMVIEGRSRLCGGNWGIIGPLCGAGGSGIDGYGEFTSGPRLDSVSGGGVMGGISNSSSPRLGVWKVF